MHTLIVSVRLAFSYKRFQWACSIVFFPVLFHFITHIFIYRLQCCEFFIFPDFLLTVTVPQIIGQRWSQILCLIFELKMYTDIILSSCVCRARSTRKIKSPQRAGQRRNPNLAEVKTQHPVLSPSRTQANLHMCILQNYFYTYSRGANTSGVDCRAKCLTKPWG